MVGQPNTIWIHVRSKITINLSLQGDLYETQYWTQSPPTFLANEKKSLRASALAQIQTGCPVSVHPGRDNEAPFEIVRILQEAGGDIKKTVMSHLDSESLYIFMLDVFVDPR